MPVLPIPHPMDEVRGGKMFWRKSNSRFPGMASRSRSERDAMPVLPIPHPMDEVRGGKMFWRKSNSRFRGVQTLHPGQLQKNKDSNPPCCPRSANNRAGRMGAIRPQPPNQDVGWSQWAHDGSANASPDPLLRSLDPISLAHRTFDTTQAEAITLLY